MYIVLMDYKEEYCMKYDFVKGIIIANDDEFEIELANTKENIASFIYRCPCADKIMIVTNDDTFLLSSMGKFLDKCCEDYRKWIIDELVAIQTYQKQPIDIEFTMNLYRDNLTKEDIIKFVSDEYGYNLVGEVKY